MKKITLTAAFFFTFIFQSFGQFNTVDNLNWIHYYQNMTNYFNLQWEEPANPHGELVGYNVYRNGELYRFQTETSVHFLPQGHNCNGDFILYGDFMGFTAYVTAVYNPGMVESEYIQTAEVGPPLLKTAAFDKQKVQVYPNPTKGILHIGNSNLIKIEICDLSGKQIRAWGAQTEIDLSQLSKGVYLIRLVSATGILTDKIVVE